MDGSFTSKQEVFIQPLGAADCPIFSSMPKLKSGHIEYLIQHRCCLVSSVELVGSLFSSVEVNNFLKIDENQNEEVENELPESPVSGS